MTDAKNTPTALELANTIKDWWETHKHDTTGDYGLRNVYDDEPEFVTKAKAVIGDWELRSFTVKTFINRSQYRDFQAESTTEGFLTLTAAQTHADLPEFKDRFEVVVIASGPHLEFKPNSVVYRRFQKDETGGVDSKEGSDDEGWFDVEAYSTRERWDGPCFGDESLDGFMKFEDAKEYADSEQFKNFFQVVVIAYGEHAEYERGETVYSRFDRPELA
jgi:hypothetical protein